MRMFKNELSRKTPCNCRREIKKENFVKRERERGSESRLICVWHCVLKLWFFKWANPVLFLIYFPSFPSNTIFTTNQCEKMSCPFSNVAGIQTHNLLNVSCLPYPLEQGSDFALHLQLTRDGCPKRHFAVGNRSRHRLCQKQDGGRTHFASRREP